MLENIFYLSFWILLDWRIQKFNILRKNNKRMNFKQMGLGHIRAFGYSLRKNSTVSASCCWWVCLANSLKYGSTEAPKREKKHPAMMVLACNLYMWIYANQCMLSYRGHLQQSCTAIDTFKWNTSHFPFFKTGQFNFASESLSEKIRCYFSPTAECYGVLHNIDFGVFWASWYCSGKEPGARNRFRNGSVRWVRSCEGSRFQRLRSPGLEICRGFEGFRRFRVSMGSEIRKVAAVSKVLEFLGSDGFEGFGDFGFRWGSEGSGTKRCRSYVGPSSCHLGVGAMRLAMLCGEWMHLPCKTAFLNHLAVGDTTYTYLLILYLLNSSSSNKHISSILFQHT